MNRSACRSLTISCMDLIDINGVRLEVEHIPASPGGVQGGEPLAPLVFLHEGLGSVAMWRDWPLQLCRATDREGWVYSRRGYGQSDAVPRVRSASAQQNGRRTGRLLPDYLHEEAWTVLPALLKTLKIDKPVLVGHSDGGSIALLHASRFPVSACIVMAPHVVVEDISIQSIQLARTAFETGDLRQRLARFHADVDCAFWQWNDVWLSDAFRSFDIREDCADITAPLLAMQGIDDAYGTMRQIDEIQGFRDRNFPTSYIDSVLYKLDQCGHSPHRDQPELTTRLIAEFLAKIA
jgi:pimeloyl-ACP methyl ester carboxylesterase